MGFKHQSRLFTFNFQLAMFDASGITGDRTNSKNGVIVINKHDGSIYGMELDKYAIH